MFRLSSSCLSRGATAASCSSTSPVAAAPAAAAAAVGTAARSSSSQQHCWFTRRNKAVEDAATLKLLLVSMRHVEIKASDLTARQADAVPLLFQSHGVVFHFPVPEDAPAAVGTAAENVDHSNTTNNNSVSTIQHHHHEPTTTGYGDPSGTETLTVAYPVRSPARGKGQWGSPFFGKVWHQPRNFPYTSSKSWIKKFSMKKHRYTKRWRKRRYKLAALANLPFARKLRVNMIPKLQQGKKFSEEATENRMDGFSPDAQDFVASAVAGKTKTGAKKRSRPRSKYEA